MEPTPEPANAVLATPVTIDYAVPSTFTLPPRRYPLVRLVCAAFGVGYPILGLLLNAEPGGDSVPIDWQNGEPLARLSLVTLPRVGWVLWPFLLFAWFSIVAAALRPIRARGWSVVSVGLWVGIAMGIEFTGVVAIGLGEGNPSHTLTALCWQLLGLPIAAIVLGGAYGIESLWRQTRRSGPMSSGWRISTIVIIVGVFIALVATGAFFVPLLGIFIAAPLSIAGHATMIWLARLPIFEPLADGASADIDRRADLRWARFITLLLVPLHALAWLFAWHASAAAYRALPTSQPEYCFVATAAARSRRSAATGHRQLRTLQTFESWLAARRPLTHAVLRRHYNVIGPLVARQVSTTGRADAMHRLLALPERAAALILARAWRR